MNDGKGWALIVFFVHFLGEVAPLSLIFWVQSKDFSKDQEKLEYTDVSPKAQKASPKKFTSFDFNSTQTEGLFDQHQYL